MPERSSICGFLLRIIRHDRLGRGHLGAEIELRVDVARGGNIDVTNTLLWPAEMSNIKASAKEIVVNETIYL